MEQNKTQYVLGLLRLIMGWIFFGLLLIKYLDLVLLQNLRCMVNWGSPTSGFLKFGVHGPFASFYQSLAGGPIGRLVIYAWFIIYWCYIYFWYFYEIRWFLLEY